MEYKEADLNVKWTKLATLLKDQIGKIPDVQSVLFLIGVNELGKGPVEFTKEQKQDLIHIGNCKVLSFSEYYSLEGIDEDGWPHWKSNKIIPYLTPIEQEKFVKWHILEYFDNE